jgi:hypothetical protein
MMNPATLSLIAACSCLNWREVYPCRLATTEGGLRSVVETDHDRHIHEAAGIPPELMPDPEPEPVKHTLGPAAVDSDRGIVHVSCSCGRWDERWAEGPMAPGWMDVEHAHRAHVLHSTRRRITPERARVTPPQFPPGLAPGLDALISAAKAMADAGAQTQAALEEFVDAHKAAQRNGVGVLVVRRPDGTVTSTPNVYLSPGTVLYVDEPGAPWLQPAPFMDARAPFESATGWAPSYTTAPPQDLPDVA